MNTFLNRQGIGLILGPLLFVLILLLPAPQGMPPAALKTAAVAVLMAVWWLTEAIPIPATALVPLVAFPTLGVERAAAISANYAHHLIFLFMGGFLIAVTVQKWGLHRRIALHTIALVGVTPSRIILGFMLATAGLSMWLSNTATSMMMVTIGTAVLAQTRTMSHTAGIPAEGLARFATALMLGIAYSASIGGVATLIGTPPNALLAGMLEKTFGHAIGFAEWMAFGLPLSIVMLVLCWWYLTRLAFRGLAPRLPGGRTMIREEIGHLGPMRWQERAVLVVFCAVALAWVLHGLLRIEALMMIKDSTIAMLGALVLFIIPVDIERREFLLDWQTALRIPWDVIILFGGGFALAHAFKGSGLTAWIGEQLTVLHGVDIVFIILAAVLVVIFLTELTSNTATASVFLPVLGAFAVAVESHPVGLMSAAAVAASFAFMLPVATPPNAIVFSSREVSMLQMLKAGIGMNLIGAALIVLFVLLVMPRVWGIDLRVLPSGFGALPGG